MTRKCGTCSFGKYVDSNHVECHGNPPQVILLPGPPDLAGNPRMMAQKLRPQMDNGEPGCHLLEDKDRPAFSIISSGDPIPMPQPVRGGGVVIR